ncbi:putative disease resistance protein RGA3 [Telopea speciosissima]|uniref:putative disease resistance protein RGA3 n=1 Tax=Telopea speciosissima TaxID=54955 RepID=UPI001CC5031E|nr:putative disease resistance protein RGA3 [Telopea speciosissima]
MVEALVSNIIQQLATFIEKEIQQEVGLVVGVKTDVDKIFRTFTKIQALLKDAEERQLTENSVRLWLQDLKDVAYDIDDVLDEWRTGTLKSQIVGVSDARIRPTKEVCPGNLFSPCFSFKRIGLHGDISHKIKEIKERLDYISSEKDKFGFIEITRNQITDESRSRLETSSFVDVSEVFGRDKDRDDIIDQLLRKDDSPQNAGSERIPVISIVGMDGMGKTTLAQLVFNHKRVKAHFNNRRWIYVSKSFDKVKVAIEIIKEIGGKSVPYGANVSWELVYHQLLISVYGEEFLLVLDDVLNEDPLEWNPLRFSLRYASQNSRIIVTTCNKRVADMMGTKYVHKLGKLCDEDWWSLLRYHAFVRGQNAECEKLEEIGMKLAKECNAFPPLAKTLGSLFYFKNSKLDWQYVSESDIWRLSSSDKTVLAMLQSYYADFPSHLKQCFAYCSMIPRGYLFDKLPTIREWIAQGFLNDRLGVSRGDLDKVGDEYFNNLVMCSFFQKDIRYSKGRFEYYQIHDLVYDFAKSLVESECFTLTIKGTKALQFSFTNKVRHLFLLIEKINMIPSFIFKAVNLRTLKINGRIPFVSSDLFRHLPCLRTLDLGGTYLEELPNEIEKLIHLRYLNLAGTRVKELPETLASMYNLQVLDLSACRNLLKLPEGTGQMVNLIDLDLTETLRLSYLPEGIGRLSTLCGLSDFIVGGVKRGGCKIGELKDLNFLKGSLRIKGLGRVENESEAKMACLNNKEHLRALHFYFSQSTSLSRVNEDIIDEDEEEEEVDGKVSLELSECRNCKQLPPTLGELPSLQTLVIAKMDKVKSIGVEFFAINSATRTFFPKLEVFQLNAMWNLKKWDMGVEEVGKEFMPRLQYLALIELPKLSLFPPHLTKATSSLRKLFIWECPKLTWMMPPPSSHLPSLEELVLKENAGSFSKSFVPVNDHMFLPKLKLLCVRKSPYSSLPQGLGKLKSLEILDIRTCSKIKSISSELGELQHLTALQELRIMRCPALRRRCQKEIGEDWSKISHIPKIFIDGEKIK